MSNSGQPAILIGDFPLPPGTRVNWHDHPMHQLTWPASGIVHISTTTGTWVLPPTRALWIPAGVGHSIDGGPGIMRAVYLDRPPPSTTPTNTPGNTTAPPPTPSNTAAGSTASSTMPGGTAAGSAAGGDTVAGSGTAASGTVVSSGMVGSGAAYGGAVAGGAMDDGTAADDGTADGGTAMSSAVGGGMVGGSKVGGDATYGGATDGSTADGSGMAGGTADGGGLAGSTVGAGMVGGNGVVGSAVSGALVGGMVGSGAAYGGTAGGSTADGSGMAGSGVGGGLVGGGGVVGQRGAAAVDWGVPTVIAVGPLLRELAEYLTRVGLKPDARRRAEAVMLDLLEPTSVSTVLVPMPSDPRALRVARAVVDRPADGRGLEAWGRVAGASGRTLARLFVAETGMSFGRWRTQVRLRAALSLLAVGTPVAVVSHQVGYATPSAFVAAFRSALGVTPGAYFGNVNG